MVTKETVIQQIIDNNFTKDDFTLEGVLRFLPRHIDRWGRLYGWDDDEFQQRAFLYMLNIKGFKNYLAKEKSN